MTISELGEGGSVRNLTNASGVVTDRYEYDAFGNSFTVSGTTPNNYLYRGEQYDPDLGLYYLRARYYNPLSGRFTGVDPLSDQGEPRYAYAGADPVDGIDPLGTEDLIECALLGSNGLGTCSAPRVIIAPSCNVFQGIASLSLIADDLPKCSPCPPKRGLSARDNRYLCLYYQPMVTKIREGAYGVDPALPLGLGFESGFATSSRYYRTGDAFGMSGGGVGREVHAFDPEDDVNELFSQPKSKGCETSPSYGERMRGTGNNIDLFLQHLERQDASGNLSITHKFCSDHDSQFDVSQPE